MCFLLHNWFFHKLFTELCLKYLICSKTYKLFTLLQVFWDNHKSVSVAAFNSVNFNITIKLPLGLQVVAEIQMVTSRHQNGRSGSYPILWCNNKDGNKGEFETALIGRKFARQLQFMKKKLWEYSIFILMRFLFWSLLTAVIGYLTTLLIFRDS